MPDITNSKNITVVIIDDDRIALLGLESILQVPGITVVAASSSPQEGLASAIEYSPDVVVIDLSMYGDNSAGIKLLTQITEANEAIKCMILTHHELRGLDVQAAVVAGARGFYRKGSMRGDQLADAVRILAEGGWVIEPELISSLLSSIGAAEAQPSTAGDLQEPVLSPRERTILQLVNRGRNIKQIADLLAISPNTVKTYLMSARKKFGDTMNSQQLAVYAALRGYLDNHPSS